MLTGKAQDPVQNSSQGKTRDAVAEQLGTSATQLRREQFIADNADLLNPADFTDWDESRLSMNKAYQRIGELLRELPKAKGNQYQNSANSTAPEEATKADALQGAGITRTQAYDLQTMAANPEVIQAVLDRAFQHGTIGALSTKKAC